MPALHHVELWVSDLERAAVEWEWLLGEVGWSTDDQVAGAPGRSWSHPDGTCLYLSPTSEAGIDRDDRAPSGLDHLAVCVESRELLDRIRSASTEHGWHERYADRYPHAGGPDRIALYLESSEGFEVELVLV